jgi:Family of unknown function (DUF5681)
VTEVDKASKAKPGALERARSKTSAVIAASGAEIAVEGATEPPTTRFRKGVSGNPAGRPKASRNHVGSRNRLGEAFLVALQADFLKHGAKTIAALRDKAPATYVNTVAGLLPKEIKASEERELSDEELLERIRQLDAIIASLRRPPGPQTPDGDA